MLMKSGSSPAQLIYGPNGFRVMRTGDHVVCAINGARISIEDLRYWDVASQRAFASAALAAEAMAPQ